MQNLRKVSLGAGMAYLSIFFSAIYANFVVLQSLWNKTDAMQTALNLSENMGQFQWGVGAFIFTFFIDLLLSYWLFLLFRRSSNTLAFASSSMRLAYTFIFGYGIYHLLAIGGLNWMVPSAVAEEASLRLELFNQYWTGGLLIFGAHLFLLGVLIVRTSAIPRWIGGLLVLAGLGYWIDGAAQFLLPNYADYRMVFELIVIIPAVIGELAITLFLLFREPRASHAENPLQV